MKIKLNEFSNLITSNKDDASSEDKKGTSIFNPSFDLSLKENIESVGNLKDLSDSWGDKQVIGSRIIGLRNNHVIIVDTDFTGFDKTISRAYPEIINPDAVYQSRIDSGIKLENLKEAYTKFDLADYYLKLCNPQYERIPSNTSAYIKDLEFDKTELEKLKK